MINLIKEFPVTTVTNSRNSTEQKIKDIAYTKEQVDILIAAAVQEAIDEAREIDRLSMRKHERDATVISMILGFICLALFLDGTLRLLGIIPPFLDIDISIVDKIADKVETEVMPMIQDAAKKIPGIR